MSKKNLSELSLEFANDIYLLSTRLVSKREFAIADQIKRSSMSIGANIHEAHGAQSPRDLVCKLFISLKEANETIYWLEILRHNNLITEEEYKDYKNRCTKICIMIRKSISTCRNNNIIQKAK